MTITVLLFASYAESIGVSSLTLELPDGAKLGDAVAAVQARSVGALPTSPLVAVNASYAKLTDLLHEGDEVAIIPPVAGG